MSEPQPKVYVVVEMGPCLVGAMGDQLMASAWKRVALMLLKRLSGSVELTRDENEESSGAGCWVEQTDNVLKLRLDPNSQGATKQ